MAAALSEEQRKFVDATGDKLLLACPGSGKTLTAAARIGRLMRDGERVAACSYTNVGVNRIASMLAEHHDLSFEPRSFNGTLHGLLLQYVVYPFGHLAGTEEPIRLWSGDWPDLPFQGDHRFHYRLDQFRVRPDKMLVFHRPDQWAKNRADEVLAQVEDDVIRRKRAFRKRGILSPDDAMWIALRILREQPRAATALAGRFDEILIDEAQDTSDLQLACLYEIRKTGKLRSLTMVGDLEQSIYAYQGASADACRKLAADSGLETMTLSENHRSSQRLCNVAANFSQRDADAAVGPHRDCEIEPELFLYPPKEPQVAIDHYRARLGVFEIPSQEAVVLARSHAMRLRLSGDEDGAGEANVKPKPRLAGEIASALAAGRLDRVHIGRAEVLLAWGAFDCHPAELDTEARARVVSTARTFIGDLPPLSGCLRTWILGARDAYSKALGRLTPDPVHPKAGTAMPSGEKHEHYAVNEVFAPQSPDLVPQTVHALKGEDRAAVLVVLKKHHGSDRSNQLQLVHSVLNGEDRSAAEEEERRIVYVALTRAERYCLLALPDDPKGRALAARCEEIGFVAA